MYLHPSAVFFFFQAEDGIRDLTVTGVQTCALPIYYEIRVDKNANDTYGAFRVGIHDDLVTALGLATQVDGHSVGEALARAMDPDSRSEERRVGKECGSGGSPEPYMKNGE